MKVLVTGGGGLVGTALRKRLVGAYPGSKYFNLTREEDVETLLDAYTPDTVIHLAAKVGGIIDNINHPAEYFDDNILMNTLLLKHCHKRGIQRFITLLSTCVYPDFPNHVYPLEEVLMHYGPPVKTNFSYGYAKKAMVYRLMLITSSTEQNTNT